MLVVDDDADTRAPHAHRAGARRLDRDRGRATGEEALDALGATRPGVVLLDLTMPVMDGFAFLEQPCAHGRTAPTSRWSC